MPWWSDDHEVSENIKNFEFWKKNFFEIFCTWQNFSKISKFSKIFLIFIIGLSSSFDCYIVCREFLKKGFNLAQPISEYQRDHVINVGGSFCFSKSDLNFSFDRSFSILHKDKFSFYKFSKINHKNLKNKSYIRWLIFDDISKSESISRKSSVFQESWMISWHEKSIPRQIIQKETIIFQCYRWNFYFRTQTIFLHATNWCMPFDFNYYITV